MAASFWLFNIFCGCVTFCCGATLSWTSPYFLFSPFLKPLNHLDQLIRRVRLPKRAPEPLVSETGRHFLLPEDDHILTLLGMLLKKGNEAPDSLRELLAAALKPNGGLDADLRLSCGGFSTGGQDWFNVTEFPGQLSISDGVGGSKVSPSDFATDLCNRMGQIASEIGFEDIDFADLDGILREARLAAAARHDKRWESAFRKSNVTTWRTKEVDVSATLMGAFCHRYLPQLLVGNVGDGSLSVYRRSFSSLALRQRVLTTEPSELNWNQPKQMISGSQKGDFYVDRYRSPLKEGDLIVAGSDGYIDNVYFQEEEVVVTRSVSPLESRLLSKAQQQGLASATSGLIDFGTGSEDDPLLAYATPPGLLAKHLTLMGRWITAYANVWSPFCLDAVVKRRTIFAQAGKADDVTVGVCWVVRKSENMPWETLPY